MYLLIPKPSTCTPLCWNVCRAIIEQITCFSETQNPTFFMLWSSSWVNNVQHVCGYRPSFLNHCLSSLSETRVATLWLNVHFIYTSTKPIKSLQFGPTKLFLPMCRYIHSYIASFCMHILSLKGTLQWQASTFYFKLSRVTNKHIVCTFKLVRVTSRHIMNPTKEYQDPDPDYSWAEWDRMHAFQLQLG